MIVQSNGNIYAGKELAHKTILVKMTGYKYPIWSGVRSSGIANVGRRWAGCECEIRVEIPGTPCFEEVVV